jgi:hypothetical protein
MRTHKAKPGKVLRTNEADREGDPHFTAGEVESGEAKGKSR